MSTTSAPLTAGQPVAVPRPGPWLAVGAAGVVLLVVAGWFLVLAPQRTAHDDLRSQVEQSESNAAALTARVATLKQQFAGLRVYQAQLAQLQEQMPADAALPDLVRALRADAAASGVELTGLVPQAPTALTGPAATTTTTTTTTTTGTDATASTPASTATDAAANGLLQVPLTLTASGSFAALEAFLAAVQQQDRLLLVSSTSFAPASGGLQLSVAGTVFVLPQTTTDAPSAAAAGQATTTTTTTTAAAPAAGTSTN